MKGKISYIIIHCYLICHQPTRGPRRQCWGVRYYYTMFILSGQPTRGPQIHKTRAAIKEQREYQ